MRTLVFLAGLALCRAAFDESNCGKPKKAPDAMSQFIVGGEEAAENSWPWIVSMRFVTQTAHSCGGSLVDVDTVVTAAHCVHGTDTEFWTLIFGAHNREDTVGQYIQSSKVTKFIVHPGYITSPTINNDIALIRLATPVTLTDQVSKICLSHHRDYPATTMYAAGWGLLESNGASPEKLQQVDLLYKDQATCEGRLGSGYLHATMLCAGHPEGGKDACQNDSGGPLAYNNGTYWELAGVTSWGFGCGDAGKPGVYARVSSYTDWIATTANW